MLVRFIMAEEIARLKWNFCHGGRGLGYRGKDLYEYVEKLTETALSKNSSKTGKGLRRDGYIDPKNYRIQLIKQELLEMTK